MATIGSLVLKIAANANSLRTGLRSAQGSISSFASKSGSLIKTGLVAAATAGAAAIASIGAAAVTTAVKVRQWYNEQADAVDSLAKTAKRIDVSADALAGWELAASEAGVSTQDLRAGLASLSNRLGQISIGAGGEPARALAALGITMDQLAPLSMAERFELIASEIAKVGSQSRRTALAASLFSDAGKKLVGLFSGDVRKTLAEAHAFAEKAGLAPGDTSQIEAANDALARLQSLWVGFKRTLAVELAPAVRAFSEVFVETFGSMKEAAKTFARTIADVLRVVLEGIKEYGGAMRGASTWTSSSFKYLEGGFYRLYAAQNEPGSAAHRELLKRAKAAEGEAFDIDLGLKKPPAVVALEKTLQFFDAFQARWDKHAGLGDPDDSRGGALRGLAAEVQRLEELRAEAAMKGLNDELQRQKTILESMATPQQKHAERMAELGNALTKGHVGWLLYARGVALANKQLADATKGTAQMAAAARFAPGSEPGSREAVNAILTHRVEGPRGKGMPDLIDEQKRANKLAEEQREEQIREARKRKQPLKIVAFAPP